MLAWIGTRRFFGRPTFSYWVILGYGVIFVLLLVPGAEYPGWRVFLSGLSIGLFARYGGEEFVILLPRTSRSQALHTLERLRETCITRPITVDDEVVDLRFSAGIAYASGPAMVDLDALLRTADESLYQAKSLGRDQTVLCRENIAEARWALDSAAAQ